MKPILFLLLTLFVGCDEPSSIDDGISSTAMYFPPLTGSEWQTLSPESLNWDTDKLAELYQLLEENDTRAFMILKDGKIVVEQYFGKDLLKLRAFDKDKNWYWASAGKTLAATMVGFAQEDGFLKLTDKTSDYLGKGWTSATEEQEDKITIWHQLTMTTGLDDGVTDNFATTPNMLVYKADAGTRWSYHNAPYTLIEKVVSQATGKSFEDYFDEKLANKIGMKGLWTWANNYHIYYSNARSMARFGLLMLNRGKWNNETVISDSLFFEAMITTSQNLNKSYGYLWWLNGEESYMVPQSQRVIKGSLTPEAPADMYSALGKNGQYLSIIPSQNIVMVRMGDNPDSSMVPFLFQNDIWEILGQVIK